MLHLKKSWAVFYLVGLGIMLLAGGSGVRPAKAEDGPNGVLLTGTYTLEQMTNACTDFPVFDLDEASQRAFAETEKRPVLWTFGVNFEDTKFGNQQPLGCFKLYMRNETEQKYIPYNDGFPVDTCEVVGDVNFAEGAAIIGAGGYVACAMNISGWVQKINEAPEPDVVSNFTAHQYRNFTLVAKFSVERFAGKPAPMPIAAFDPENPLDNPQYDAAVLSLSSAQELGSCGPLSLKTDYYAWYDLNAAIANPQYAYQLLGKAPNGCGPALGATPFDFPPSQGKLYIGRDLTSMMQGALKVDGVLVDPTDSKPPEGAEPTDTPSPTPESTNTPTPPFSGFSDPASWLCLAGILLGALVVVGLILLRQRKTSP